MHMPEVMIERMVERFRALADASRIRLLLALKEGPHCVNQLVEGTGIAQASVSKHLGQLKAAGYVQAQRRGNQTFYTIRDPAIFTICQTMCSGVAAQAAADFAAIQAASPST